MSGWVDFHTVAEYLGVDKGSVSWLRRKDGWRTKLVDVKEGGEQRLRYCFEDVRRTKRALMASQASTARHKESFHQVANFCHVCGGRIKVRSSFPHRVKPCGHPDPEDSPHYVGAVRGDLDTAQDVVA